jgi:hypothetical protein
VHNSGSIRSIDIVIASFNHKIRFIFHWVTPQTPRETLNHTSPYTAWKGPATIPS